MDTRTEDTFSTLKPRLIGTLKDGAAMFDQWGHQPMADEMRSAAQFIQHASEADMGSEVRALVRLLGEYHAFLIDNDFTFLGNDVGKVRASLLGLLNREEV